MSWTLWGIQRGTESNSGPGKNPYLQGETEIQTIINIVQLDNCRYEFIAILGKCNNTKIFSTDIRKTFTLEKWNAGCGEIFHTQKKGVREETETIKVPSWKDSVPSGNNHFH